MFPATEHDSRYLNPKDKTYLKIFKNIFHVEWKKGGYSNPLNSLIFKFPPSDPSWAPPLNTSL